MKEDIIQIKTYEFTKEIIELYKVIKKQNEFELASQILRSGTSIGANVEETIGGHQKEIS